MHQSRTNIGKSWELNSVLHAHGNVWDRTELDGTHGRKDNVAQATYLHTLHGMCCIGHAWDHCPARILAYATIEDTKLHTTQTINLGTKADIEVAYKCGIVMMVDAHSDIGQPMPSHLFGLCWEGGGEDNKEKEKC